MLVSLEELAMPCQVTQKKRGPEDELAATATSYARYAMADVEFALRVLGTEMSSLEYRKVFQAMIIRKAKNELRKYNAKQ
jgi:hypothetical protein